MDREEFEQFVLGDAQLAGPIRRVASAGGPKTFGLITEAAVVALMFPLVKYVLTHIGLPWLHELKRISELKRQKLHRWIDERYRQEGFDPEAAEAAGDALCDELQSTTDAEARSAWQRLLELIQTTD